MVSPGSTKPASALYMPATKPAPGEQHSRPRVTSAIIAGETRG